MTMLLVQKSKRVELPMAWRTAVPQPSPPKGPPMERGSWVLSLELSFDDRKPRSGEIKALRPWTILIFFRNPKIHSFVPLHRGLWHFCQSPPNLREKKKINHVRQKQEKHHQTFLLGMPAYPCSRNAQNGVHIPPCSPLVMPHTAGLQHTGPAIIFTS